MSQTGERPESPGEPVEDVDLAENHDVAVSADLHVDLTRESAREVFDRIMESRARRTKGQP